MRQRAALFGPPVRQLSHRAQRHGFLSMEPGRGMSLVSGILYRSRYEDLGDDIDKGLSMAARSAPHGAAETFMATELARFRVVLHQPATEGPLG